MLTSIIGQKPALCEARKEYEEVDETYAFGGNGSPHVSTDRLWGG